jgi:general secretion pathway protein G
MFEIIRKLIFAGIAAGLIAGNSEEIGKLFDETVEYSQMIATSGDLRAVSQMLDYYYMKKGRYPDEKIFALWFKKNFKENNLKDNLSDHFGSKYIYETKDGLRGYVLVSKGADKIRGTKDDLIVSGP